MEIIRVSDVYYDYENPDDTVDTAVNGVSLSVKKGEWLSVIGHNGSGKSTLAKLLNGLFLPREGTVTVEGIDTTDEERIWELRQKVGMIFQNPDNQMVATVVEEDVAFGLENVGIAPEEIRARVDEALAAVNMSQFAGAAPHMLSGGQKQRVAIAGVLAMKPDVILMDEPTAMLDPSGRREVMETVQRLHREEGMTVVLITHFMEEALRGDRVIVMEKGKTVMEGSPREVFTKVETLKGIGLDVPPMTELAHRLKKHGVELDESLMTVEEMVEELCRLKQKI